jgi:hypothetical protein
MEEFLKSRLGVGVVTTVLAAAIGLAAYLGKRWLDRPRLRVKLRDHDIVSHADCGRIVFEARNTGRTAASLAPSVRLSGLLHKFRRRFWYPTVLKGRLTEEQIQRWCLCIPIERASRGRFTSYYDLEGEGAALRLESHSGPRTFTAKLRGSRIPPFPVFCTLDFRLDGRRRTRLHFIWPSLSAVPLWRFCLWRVLFTVFGRLPKTPAETSLSDWQSEREARD